MHLMFLTKEQINRSPNLITAVQDKLIIPE